MFERPYPDKFMPSGPNQWNRPCASAFGQAIAVAPGRAPERPGSDNSVAASSTIQPFPLPNQPVEADNGSNTYFAPPSRSTTDYCEINVCQEGYSGTFYHEVETKLGLDLSQLIQRQPAQIQPRTQWPAEMDTVFVLDLHGEFPQTPQAQAVPPRAPFASDDAAINTPRWADHCSDLWSLFKATYNNDWPSKSGLESFLILASYGMRDVVAVSPGALIISKQWAVKVNKEGEAFNRTSDYLPDWMEVAVSADLSLGYTSKSQFKQATFNKRFFIGMVYYQDLHWASYIFDRQQGQVYYYDTLLPQLAERRKAFAVAFRQFLVENGYPYNFTVFCPPVTAQPSIFECGYLAAFLVFTNIRSLVGASREELTERSCPSSIKIDDMIGPKAENFCLPQRDWVVARYPIEGPLDPSLLDTAVKQVRQFICVAIFDELGIRKYKMSSHGRRRQVTDFGPYIYRPMTRLKELPLTQIHTNRGGFQVIEWPFSPVITNWTLDRVIAIPQGFQGFIRTEPLDPNPPKCYALNPIHQLIVDVLRHRGVTQQAIDEMMSFHQTYAQQEGMSSQCTNIRSTL